VSHTTADEEFDAEDYSDSLWHDQITIGTGGEEPGEIPAKPVDPVEAGSRRQTMGSLSAELLDIHAPAHGNLSR
jgi:hypothetical protein